MPSREVVDFVIIGAGPAGENIAEYATAETDLTAVIIERELVGGECSYYACMPSKALLRPIEVVATAHHLGGIAGAQLDIPALLRRRDEWVSHYDDAGQVAWAEGVGLRVVRGTGHLAAERLVRVSTGDGELQFEARHAVVIASGSEAVVPEPYAACAPWGSRDATGIVEIPERIAIIGGGVVACEAATWLAALGSSVTMLVRDDRLLARVEPFAADLVADGLRRAGVAIRLGAEVSAVDRPDARERGLGRIHGGPVTLTVAGEDVVADELLVAIGRRPRLADVGLESVGLDSAHLTRRAGDAPAEGADGIPDWLVLVGDASGEAALTHWGKYRARVLGARLASQATGEPAPWEPANVPVPQVIFTDPVVASVGLTEREAGAAGHRVAVTTMPWTAAAGAALLRDDIAGSAQLVVDEDTHLLLGATFVGPDAAELIHAATVAIVGAIPTETLRHAVPSYPTVSELWLRLLEDLPPHFRFPQVGGTVLARGK